MSKKQDKIHEDLIKDLQASDDQLVMTALNKIKTHGTIKIIPYLLAYWYKSEGELHQAASEILYSLKDKNAIPVLFDELDKTTVAAEREKIISIFWNAGLEPKEYLNKLVTIAIEGEFMEAVECLTVIENMEPPFPEDQLMDSLLNLKEYFSKNPSGEKVNIIRSVATIIQYTDEHQFEL